ncbi:MAG: MaoC family dehydratase N-terminal domain-containing protein [Caulobacteraceae bacterium]|nr:MaoC family dehydratase N-terminal domain-containing protein [Caulobacteraceae bacterium]
MPDPTYGKITDERVDKLRSRIGLDLNPENFLPLDPEVERNWKPKSTGFIHELSGDTGRHFVNGYGDDNPLYCDPDYGKTSRWGRMMAAPTIIWTFHGDLDPPRELKPEIAAQLKGDPLRGVGELQADVTYEWYRPIFHGDRIYSKRAFTGLADKTSSWGGRAVHVTRSTVGVNQDRQITHLLRGMWIRGERRPVSEVRDPQPKPEPYTEEQLAEIDACYASEVSTRRGATPRYWEDVEVGEELPRLVKGPIRITDLILFHAGFGQSFPTFAHRIAYETRKSTPGLYTRNKLNVWDIVQRMHWEEDWAHQVGAATIYDYGAIRETFLAHLVTNWMGDDAFLRRLQVQHRKFNFAGDTNWLLGRVAKKVMTQEGAEVHLDVRIENQRGLCLTPGNAVVLLPSRERGPVKLPDPPASDPDAMLRHEVEELRRQNGG